MAETTDDSSTGCSSGSMFTHGVNPSKLESEYEVYYNRLIKTYQVLSYFKIFELALLLTIIAFSLWRNHHLTCFQWFLLMQLLILFSIELPYFFTFQNGEMDNCRSVQKIYAGACYCFMLGISLLLAWQF